MANMLDDHDLIDGFGSYDDVTQASPVFSRESQARFTSTRPATDSMGPYCADIGSRGIFFYQLFQLFIVDEFDGTLPHIPHSNLSIITGGPGPWVPFDNHSFLIWSVSEPCVAAFPSKLTLYSLQAWSGHSHATPGLPHGAQENAVCVASDVRARFRCHQGIAFASEALHSTSRSEFEPLPCWHSADL